MSTTSLFPGTFPPQVAASDQLPDFTLAMVPVSDLKDIGAHPSAVFLYFLLVAPSGETNKTPVAASEVFRRKTLLVLFFMRIVFFSLSKFVLPYYYAYTPAVLWILLLVVFYFF